MKITTLDENSLAEAAHWLAARDTRLAFSLERYGVPPLWTRAPGFPTLVHIILEQQVSLASARAAFTRLQQTLGRVTPENFLPLDDATLKAVGFSRQKTRYCRLLAEAVTEQGFSFEAWERLPDDEVEAALTQFKGVGVWTARIYLLMALLRADVWPIGDLALVLAWQDLTGADERPTQEQLAACAAHWRPFRAVAARLLWNHYLQR